MTIVSDQDIHDIKDILRDIASRLEAVASLAEQANAGVGMVYEKAESLEVMAIASQGRYREIADGVLALSADLQQLRESVTKQASHDAERRAKLEKSVEELEEEFEREERASIAD